MTDIDKRAGTIRAMFDAIAPVYDFLNTVLSFGMDGIWRRRLANAIVGSGATRVLDVCCGSGSLSRTLRRTLPRGSQIVAADFSAGMLFRACKRQTRVNGFSRADCLELPFGSNTFDAVTVAWGIRNIADRARGLSEIARVCRAGGTIAVLEFTAGDLSPIFACVFTFYLTKVLPLIGACVSGDGHAYSYLPQSVALFPLSAEFAQELATAAAVSVEEVSVRPLTFGITTLFVVKKRNTAL